MLFPANTFGFCLLSYLQSAPAQQLEPSNVMLTSDFLRLPGKFTLELSRLSAAELYCTPSLHCINRKVSCICQQSSYGVLAHLRARHLMYLISSGSKRLHRFSYPVHVSTNIHSRNLETELEIAGRIGCSIGEPTSGGYERIKRIVLAKQYRQITQVRA